MKFSVLAIDYDGTIAKDDVLDPGVRSAIAALRSRDVAVVLATGRRLDDLRRVAGNLHFVDAVVAENGAALEFPASGYSTVLGERPPARLIEQLQRHGITFMAGNSIIEAEARNAAAIFEIVKANELPLVLVFNRSRVMVLPQAISKATGLRAALTMLRLSRHNAVAIGDAENDYELLQACEYSVAVDWGSAFLKQSADFVLPGSGPAAVASYLHELSTMTHLPVSTASRHRLHLGHGEDGRRLDLAVRGRNVLIAGDLKSGKSWVAGLLCEQLILQGYSVCILDAEGDYVALEALPGVTVLGGADPLPRPREVLRVLRHADVSLVIDLSHRSHAEKVAYLNAMLPALATLRRETGLPHRIAVDEAHYFLDRPDSRRLVDLQLNGYTLVTYRASLLDESILASTEAVVVTRESDPREVHTLFAACGSCVSAKTEPQWVETLANLPIGDAVVLPVTSEAEGEMRRIRLVPRLTPHVRHEAKYIDVPVPEGRGFVFWRDGRPTGSVRTLRECVAVLETLPSQALDGHLRRGDLSRWFEDVFGDYPLAKAVRLLEARYRTGEDPTVGPEIVDAVRRRYHFNERIHRAVAGGMCDCPSH